MSDSSPPSVVRGEQTVDKIQSRPRRKRRAVFLDRVPAGTPGCGYRNIYFLVPGVIGDGEGDVRPLDEIDPASRADRSAGILRYRQPRISILSDVGRAVICVIVRSRRAGVGVSCVGVGNVFVRAARRAARACKGAVLVRGRVVILPRLTALQSAQIVMIRRTAGSRRTPNSRADVRYARRARRRLLERDPRDVKSMLIQSFGPCRRGTFCLRRRKR